jgi:hypothetical protein
MGKPIVQLRVADAIGVDAFLAMWRIYDAEPSCGTESDDLNIRMRSYRSYLRFQRNLYIEGLSGTGKSTKSIQKSVHRHLCERISIRHITRIISGT